MVFAHRYFFCLPVAADVARRIGLLRDGLACQGTTVANERLHVTLGITHDYAEHSPELARALVSMGGSIEAEPFRFVVDRLSGSGSTLALRPSRCPPELSRLQRQIDSRLAYHGVRRDGWSFNPHITLIYRKGEPFLRPVQPYGWDAAELVLIHSLIGATRHIELGRWPLIRRQLDLLGG